MYYVSLLSMCVYLVWLRIKVELWKCRSWCRQQQQKSIWCHLNRLLLFWGSIISNLCLFHKKEIFWNCRKLCDFASALQGWTFILHIWTKFQIRIIANKINFLLWQFRSILFIVSHPYIDGFMYTKILKIARL